MSKVFISGSISIKILPLEVIKSIQIIIDKDMTILVGDAPGIDSLIQDFCNEKNYLNVIVYTITSVPRYKANEKFKEINISVSQDIKSERTRQTFKDKAMSKDSNFSLVIWDGSSKGSYANTIRALENNKKVKVYHQEKNNFIDSKKVTINEIDYIYRENNGYKASEIIKILQEQGIEKYKRSQDLNKFLLDKNLLTKEGKVYHPTDKESKLFIIEKFRGKISGVKFSNQFIDWIEENSSNSLQQTFTF